MMMNTGLRAIKLKQNPDETIRVVLNTCPKCNVCKIKKGAGEMYEETCECGNYTNFFIDRPAFGSE